MEELNMADAITEIELAEDVKKALAQSPLVTALNPEVESRINGTDDFELLKITKTISSPIVIHDAVIVDDALLDAEF